MNRFFEKYKIFNAIILMSITFAFAPIAAKDIVMTVSPFTVAFYRFILTSITLYIILKISGRTIQIEKIDYWRFITLALLAVPINQITFLIGMQYTPASHPAMLYATTPAWVLILTVYLGVEKARWWKWVGIFLAIFGVFILFYGEILSFRKDTLLGDILILFAVISWSLYTALGKPIVERYGSLESTFIIMTFGMFMYFPVGFTFAILNDYAVFTINNLIALLTLGIFVSGIGSYLWYWLLERIRPSQVAIMSCAQPPLVAFIEWMVYGLAPTTNVIIGSIIIVSSVFIMIGYGGQKRSISSTK